MKFSQLSEVAKERVRKVHQPHSPWWEDVYELMAERGLERGFKIKRMRFSGFWSQGDGASWEGRVMLDKYAHYKKEEKDKDARWQIMLAMVEANDAWGWLDVQFDADRYCHENTMRCDNTIFISAADEIVSAGMLKGARCGDLHIAVGGDAFENEVRDEVQEAARGYAREIYSALEKEYEYLTSDEYFEELGEFDEHGVLE